MPKVRCRRHERWKEIWSSGGYMIGFHGILWAARWSTACTLMISECGWRLWRNKIRERIGEVLQQIDLKRGQSLNIPWAFSPTPGTNWVDFVVIWRSSRSILIWSHHPIIQSRVSYTVLVDTQHMSYEIGNYFTSFLGKVFTRARTALMSTTYTVRWNFLLFS